MTQESLPDAAVLLMAYGGPRSLDEVGPFMTELMGREPSEEVLDRVKLRYLAIGGASPLPEIAGDMAFALEKRLAEDGYNVPVAVGFQYAEPRIGEMVKGMYGFGIRRIVAVSLSPLESPTTGEAYRKAIAVATEGLEDLEIIDAPLVSSLREFEITLAGGLAVALEALPEEAAKKALIVLTAHSLPVTESGESDAYRDALYSVANRLSEGLGLDPGIQITDDERLPGITTYGALDGSRGWVLAYQSKGQRDCEWLGPTLDEVIDAAAAGGFLGMAVQPIGFATDHMETLYDLDIEAAGKALDAGIEFQRGDVPNDSQVFIEGLTKMVVDCLGLAAAGSQADGEGTDAS